MRQKRHFYKLLLNLSLLLLLGLLIWFGIKLFGEHTFDATYGALAFIIGIVALIYLWLLIRKRKWISPSLKLTVFALIVIFLITSFAGVQPMAEYKDKIVDKITTFIKAQNEQANIRSANEKAEEIDRLQNLGVSNPSIVVEEITTNEELKIGLEVLETVNAIRKERGSSELLWDDKLYAYSLAHANNMANQRQLFHTNMYESYAENAWGGEGSKSWTAQDIVDSWMNSKMHRTWLLCPNLRRIAVGVAYSPNGMYAAWTFWRNETSQSDWWYQYTPDTPPKWWY